jgi:hypothetical protein
MGGIGTQRTITMTIAAWVSDGTARETYHAAQRELLGGDNRLEEEKARRRFWFVEERTDNTGKRNAAWDALRKEWNRPLPALGSQ